MSEIYTHEQFLIVQNQKEWNLKYAGDDIANIKILKNRSLEIICKGSDSKMDWILNFLSWPFQIRRPYRDMRKGEIWHVHYGLFKRFRQIKNQIFNFIIDDYYENGSFPSAVILGYSHGAAIATYISEWLSYNYFVQPNNVHCVTFGGPKCIDKNGYRILSRRVPIHQTIINGNDIVTKIPPWFKRPWINVYIGPKRKWWKFSIEDHKGY